MIFIPKSKQYLIKWNWDWGQVDDLESQEEYVWSDQVNWHLFYGSWHFYDASTSFNQVEVSLFRSLPERLFTTCGSQGRCVIVVFIKHCLPNLVDSIIPWANQIGKQTWYTHNHWNIKIWLLLVSTIYLPERKMVLDYPIFCVSEWTQISSKVTPDLPKK